MSYGTTLEWVADEDVPGGARAEGADGLALFVGPTDDSRFHWWELMWFGGTYANPNERTIADGEAENETEAKWAVLRRYERALVAEDAANWLLEMSMAGNPDDPNPDWWKAR